MLFSSHLASKCKSKFNHNENLCKTIYESPYLMAALIPGNKSASYGYTCPTLTSHVECCFVVRASHAREAAGLFC